MADLTLEIYNAAWVTATAYVANQYVSNDSRDYVCIVGHTSGVLTEPGTGVIWRNCWRQSEAKKTLMLARDNGVAMWKSYEVAQDGGNQDKPIWSQTDWSGGFGQGDFADPSRYSLGDTIDTSHEGYFCLPPLDTAESLAVGTLSGWVRHICYAPALGLFMIDGTSIFKYNTGTGVWDNKATLSGCKHMCAHDGYLYIACGSNSYYYTSNGTVYTQVAVTAHSFCSAPPYAGNDPVLWAVTGTNTIASSEDPTDADSWTTNIYIGDSTGMIGAYGYTSGLFIHQGQLMIGKTDGLYHYDSDGVVHKLLRLDRGNGVGMAYPFWSICELRGASYFTTADGIGELTSYNSYDRIEPIRNVSDVDIMEGVFTGVASDGEYLYAMCVTLQATTYASKIYKGKEIKDSEGNSAWAWHPIKSMTGLYLGLYCPPSPTSTIPKLYCCEYMSAPATAAYALRSYKVPLNPFASTVAYSDTPTFATTGYLETGWIDLGYRDWYKIVDSVLVECRGTMGTDAVAYQADESGSYTTIGTYSATTSGTKDYVATAPFAAKKFKLKITLTGATTASTPIVKYVAVYGSVRPNRVTLMDFMITAEEGHSATSKGLRDFLIHCRDSTGLHTLTDRFGASHYVRILPGYPTETEYLDSSRKQPALGLRLICEKVDWS
jgi:hypothetical protein